MSLQDGRAGNPLNKRSRYFYCPQLCGLDYDGSLGNAAQSFAATAYMYEVNRMGWLQRNREEDVLQDVIRRYFELIDKYILAGRSAS